MRAAGVWSRFGRSELAVRERDVPVPGAGEALLRVRAAALNYRDLLVANGDYNPSFPLPLTIGSDAVGEVVALGQNTEHSGIAVGDRVCPLLPQGWLSGAPSRDATRFALGGPLPGTFAEYALTRADSAVPVPSYLTDEEAASLPCAALTAWSALVTLSPVRAGDVVFTIGTGGVSIFAIQIARLLGARVIGSSRDPEKRARLAELGVVATIDPANPRWGDRVRELAGGEGVDHVIEVGGASTLEQSLRAARPGGTISLIGRFGRTEAVPSLLPAVMRNLRLQGVYVGHRESFRAMLEAFARAELRPVIDSVHALERVGDAFARLESGRHFGKICLKI
jgi:NADPH:quinone reductase-like Zn-dependent oxidoreductase